MTTLIGYIKKSPHRNRLEKLLSNILPTLEGPLLDIGSKDRRYDYLLKETPVAIDIIENKTKNIQYGDIEKLSFPDNSFQSILCIEMLEYISNPSRAMDEMYRVLKKDGTLVLSVPFMFKTHNDKLRYAAPYLKELLSKFEIVTFGAVGGSYTVVLTIVWNKIKKISFLPFRTVLMLCFLPLLLFSRRSRTSSEQYASGYFVIAKK